MKIAYNPSGASPLAGAPKNNNDIIFDLAGKAIYVKDVKLLGTDTVYDVFKKHTSSNGGGNVGLVPVPSYTNTNTRFLREDGTWVVPTNTTYAVFTGSTLENSGKAGLVPAPSAGLKKLLQSDGTWTQKFLSYDIPANSAIKITFYSQTHATLFMRHTFSSNMGVYHISGYGSYGDTKRISIVEVINSCSGIIYPVDGEFAIIIKNPVTTNSLFVSATLQLGSISKIETVTSEVTKSDIWRNVLHSDNAFIKNGTININGVSITPLTQHQSLSNYVTLDTAQVITGYKDFTRQVKISTAGNPLKLTSSTTYCDIGFSITNSDGTTVGSGIVLRGNADFKIFDAGWSNEYTILHSNNYTQYKHAYTNLTGSGTTANQAIVSTGTANGWTLKTLGSNAFDSTAYLPLSGGTLSGDLNFGHLSAYVKGYITWTGGTVLQRIQISDNSNTNDAVFTFQQSTNSGTDWTDLFTIKDNGQVAATTFQGNATSATKLQTSRTIWGQSFDGTANVTGHLYIPNNNYIYSYNTAGTAVSLLSVDTANQVNFAFGAAARGLTSYINGNIIIFRYGTGHTEALRIDSSGNVGIGITSPTQKLHVQGNVAATSFIGNLDWSYITNKPTSFTPSAHTHTTKQITACTDYAMASQRGNVSTEDSLNAALGKIEYKAQLGVAAYDLVKAATDDDGTIENLNEILKVLQGISDTDTIQGIMNKYLPLAGGTMTGNLNLTVDTAYISSRGYALLAHSNSTNFTGVSMGVDTTVVGNTQYTTLIRSNNTNLVHYKYNTAYNILDASNTFINSGVITINGTSITPLTQHQSLSNYVTLDTYQKITGQKLFNTSNNTLPLLIAREGNGESEVLKIGIDDHNATFEYVNDETSNSFLFKLVNTDIENGGEGINANSSQVKFYGGAGGSVVIANRFMGQLDKTLTFAAGAFTAKTYNNNTAVTVNIPTHTSHLTNNSGFLTQHQSLANYVTLNTNQTISGVKTFSGGVALSCGLNINGIRPITWNDGTYHQRIQVTDDSDTNTNLFEFQQSKDTGATWESLFTIKDNGNVVAAKFITIGGTSSQFLKGDGSVDSNTYATTTQLDQYLPLTGGTLSGPLTIAPINTSGAQEGLILQDAGSGSGERLNIKWISSNYGPVALRPNHDYTQLSFYNGTTDYTLLHSGNYSSYLPILNSASTHATKYSVIYAPTTSGISGQVLVSNGSGAPVWKSGTQITAAPVEYGLQNLCIRVAAGSSTSVTNNIITTSGVDSDTYFKLILSEPLEVDQYYTLGFYVENVPQSATLWSFGVGNQSNTNWIINITQNGWVWATGYYNNNGNSQELLIDDVSRNFYNSIKISKIVLVKGKQKAYYSPAPINLSNYISYLGYIGTTKVQASSAAQALTGITSATITGVTSTNTLTISNTSGVGHINFSRGSYNYITMPSGGVLHILPNGAGVSSGNGMVFSSNGLHPATNSAYSLGTSSLRWNNVYSVSGNYSGNLTLQTSSGDSPHLVFLRKALTDDHFDWDMYVTGGIFKLRCNTGTDGAESWKEVLSLNSTNSITTAYGITASTFIKSNSSDSYILLGGGSHKAVSDFLLKSELENLELNSNTTTIEKSLQVTKDWMDTGIKSADIPANGSYIVQVYLHASDDTFYACYWTGLMSWYSDAVNDTESDEILLHRAGHAYNNTIYLRTKMTGSINYGGAGEGLKLQIAANKDLSAAYTFKFKFKRVI